MDQYAGLIFLAVPLLLIWMVFTRTRRQQRILAAAQAAVRPGLWAMTTSGLHGRVTSADNGPTVLLEIAPGIQTRWARLAIAEVFEQDPAVTGPIGSIVDLTTDDAHGTTISSPKEIDDPTPPDDSHPDDRTHN